MEARNQIEIIVPPPPPNSSSRQNASSRSPSVQRALQFTPITTSVLPAHDRIPFPQICRPKESARLTSSMERKSMQLKLKEYPITKVKEKLRDLLLPETLAEIKFKQRLDNDFKGAGSKVRSTQPEYSLTPIAKTILDASSIDYRYVDESTPIKESPPISQTQETREFLQELPSPPQPPQGSFLRDPVTPSSAKAELPSDIPSGPRSVVIHIPKPPSDFRREDYVTASDSIKRLKITQNEASSENALRIRSQKEASDAALLLFQNNLMEIFEAQDQLDAGSTTAQDAGFFKLSDEGDETEPRLSLKTLDKLQVSLQKLVSMKRLPDMSAEHLRRLQGLCEPIIDRCQTIGIRLEGETSSEDEEEWRQRLIEAQTGIAAASVCLYIILGCPTEETILSSDARLWIPNVLVNVFESCLVPIIESRSEGQGSDLFSTAIRNKDELRRLLDSGKKLLDVMTTVCTDVQGTDSSVNPVEFLCAKLIFVQNAPNDKNSCLGIQIFEKVRKTAMSCLARIYARYPAERRTVLDEILSSLDRLPSNSRSARQYRVADGKSIQLITALFMQLVQTTSLDVRSSHRKTKRKAFVATNKNSPESGDDVDDNAGETEDEEISLESNKGPIGNLRGKSAALHDSSFKGAYDIIIYLVSRASKTTKSGDSPYRNVLDLFIEDLVTVLPLPEWPSSELMLRLLARRMTDLATNDKAASTKNMALESLGVMGSAISTLRASIPTLSAVLERDQQAQSDTSKQLCELARKYQENGGLLSEDVVSLDGPFALVCRHMCAELGESLRSRSAAAYLAAHYARIVSKIQGIDSIDQTDIEAQPVRVANWLLQLIPQIGSDTVDLSGFDLASSEEVELAYVLCLLSVGFCSALPLITKTLTASFSSDQAQVRSRSLKSVVAMLETDSSLLDRTDSIVDDVFKCASDDSAMVRDSALSLIARFIIVRPALRQRGVKRLLECASDSKVGVQKRAMGHLKDIYLGENRNDLRAIISFTFLQRTNDHEESVAELAKKALTELWINPAIIKLSESTESKKHLAIQEISTEMVRCITYNIVELSPLLQKFFNPLLVSTTKSSEKVRELCSLIVDELFERTISGATEQGPLHALAAFAAADPRLVQPDRLAKLQHYLANVKTENDLFMFTSVIKIFRSVLPQLSVTHKPLLIEIQGALLKATTNLGRRIELDSVMRCLATIDQVISTKSRLLTLAVSLSKKIKQFENDPPNLIRIVKIAGAMTRYLDLEVNASEFSRALGSLYKGTGSIASHWAATFLALCQPSKPVQVRGPALESLGSLCQAEPSWFDKTEIRKMLFSFFKSRSDDASSQKLRFIVLQLFDELYATRVHSKDIADKAENDAQQPEQQELGKLGGDSRTRDGDSAVLIITSHVVTHAMDVALSSEGDIALVATRILASISHEGLVHPRQSTGAFVALSSSRDDRIASIAAKAQQQLQTAHESVVEREYTNAVQATFDYQVRVVQDPTGARSLSYTAKLSRCFEIISSSGSKHTKKFLSGIVSRVGNDVAAQDKKGHTRDHVLNARFVLQNLAFFEYVRLDDLLHTILQLEIAYSKTGGEVAQILEKSMADKLMEVQTSEATETITEHETESHANDHETVRKFAPIAATLTLLMETRSYLKRQYGIGRDVRAAIASSKQSKESSKMLVKVHGITGERFWTKSNSIAQSLDDEMSMLSCCRNFISMMNVDEDIDIDANNPMGDVANGVTANDMNGYTGGGGGTPNARKRKGSASVGGTPVKKNRGRPRASVRRSASISSAEDMEADYEE